MTWPGGSRELARTGVGTGSQVTITFDAPPGTSSIQFLSTDDPTKLSPPSSRPLPG